MPEERRAAIIQTMPAVARFWASEFAETTPTEVYAKLGAPTLLVRGRKTRATAHDIVELLDGLLLNAAIVEIDGAGHRDHTCDTARSQYLFPASMRRMACQAV